MTDNLLKSKAFILKGRLYTLTVLSILESDPELLRSQLTEIIAKAPKMFHQTPVVLDFSEINNTSFSLVIVINCLREQGLLPIAVQGVDQELAAIARDLGLGIMHASASQDKTINYQAQAKLYTAPIRSGQQIVSKHDLIVTSSVSHGAEVLADGNIHVYGVLRGRALAGISGNENARIFCQALEAELISIAGRYRISDTIEPIAEPCQIYLTEDRIQIERL